MTYAGESGFQLLVPVSQELEIAISFIGLASVLELEGPEEVAVSPGRLGKLQQQLRGRREEWQWEDLTRRA